jgi:hypothetical protein
MPRYPLHELTDAEFEDLVVKICRRILGIGTTSFAAGRDGGKDASFVGTAGLFPSSTAPATGKFVIQAKHTTNPYGSCSDKDFEANASSVVSKEIPKLKKQFDDGLLTHFLLYTNRRKAGGADVRISARIKSDTGIQHVWVRGYEDIEQDLIQWPDIVRGSGLEKLRSPIVFTPEDMRDVILAFYAHRPQIATTFDSKHDYRDYPGLAAKNLVNGLSELYFKEMILEGSEPLFPEIRKFLQNPRNATLLDHYHAVANELKAQLILHRNRFESFDNALEHLYALVSDRSSELHRPEHRRLARVFLHYMYVHCDIGAKGT